jgi:hypothetical protein
MIRYIESLTVKMLKILIVFNKFIYKLYSNSYG